MKQIFWLTGLPCSGKTTIAKELAKKINAEILDGDDLRANMKNSDFSEEGRKKHMLNIAWIASLLSKHTNVIVSLVSPIKSVREEIMDKYPNTTMLYCYASLEECEKRDVKGMYKLARAGKITNFTGIDAEYEVGNYKRGESHRHYYMDTELWTVEECVAFIVEKFAIKEGVL
jgi:adenylylsulfate kinase